MKKINFSLIENFVSLSSCESLIADLINVGGDGRSKFHGGRTYLPNTDDDFLNLINQSPAWSDLYSKINSPEFLDFCLTSLNLEKQRIVFDKFFTKPVHRWLTRVHLLRAKRLREISLIGTLAYSTYLIYRYVDFYFYKLKNYIFGNKTAELLFDVSVAENGYTREIHRDSDSRLIVFLIYFNALEENATGGTLDLHEYIGTNKEDPPARPDPADCRLLNAIKAKAGNLVIFENNNFAFHSVPLMSGHSRPRFFCYGSFTITAGVNPFLEKSRHSIPTQWRMWL